MAQTTSKAAAAAAAKELLRDRIALIEDLGEALDAHAKAVAAVDQARKHADDTAAAARTAFDAAKTAGWTAAELNSTGLKPPPAPRPRAATRKQTRADAAEAAAAETEPAASSAESAA